MFCAPVFPACAGMFLAGEVTTVTRSGFPRVRGDVPFVHGRSMTAIPFSPRARGCSHLLGHDFSILWVFPACAGMFLLHNPSLGHLCSFPRVRGDVPNNQEQPST